MVATAITPYGCSCVITLTVVTVITLVVKFTLLSLYAHELLLHCCVRLCIMNVVNTVVCT